MPTSIGIWQCGKSGQSFDGFQVSRYTETILFRLICRNDANQDEIEDWSTIRNRKEYESRVPCSEAKRMNRFFFGNRSSMENFEGIRGKKSAALK